MKLFLQSVKLLAICMLSTYFIYPSQSVVFSQQASAIHTKESRVNKFGIHTKESRRALSLNSKEETSVSDQDAVVEVSQDTDHMSSQSDEHKLDENDEGKSDENDKDTVDKPDENDTLDETDEERSEWLEGQHVLFSLAKRTETNLENRKKLTTKKDANVNNEEWMEKKLSENDHKTDKGVAGSEGGESSKQAKGADSKETLKKKQEAVEAKKSSVAEAKKNPPVEAKSKVTTTKAESKSTEAHSAATKPENNAHTSAAAHPASKAEASGATSETPHPAPKAETSGATSVFKTEASTSVAPSPFHFPSAVTPIAATQAGQGFPVTSEGAAPSPANPFAALFQDKSSKKATFSAQQFAPLSPPPFSAQQFAPLSPPPFSAQQFAPLSPPPFSAQQFAPLSPAQQLTPVTRVHQVAPQVQPLVPPALLQPLSAPVLSAPVLPAAPLSPPVLSAPVLPAAPLSPPILSAPVLPAAPLSPQVVSVPVLPAAPLSPPAIFEPAAPEQIPSLISPTQEASSFVPPNEIQTLEQDVPMTSPEEKQLPKGWQLVKSGSQTFYWNRYTKERSTTFPEVAAQQPVAVRNAVSETFGEIVAKAGEEPMTEPENEPVLELITEPESIPSSEPQQPDLPEGWKAVADPVTGNIYYWNTVTNGVTWAIPKASQTMTSMPVPYTENSGLTEQLTQQITNESIPQEVGEIAASSEVSTTAVGPVSITDLPDGWQMFEDPESQSVFYWNDETTEAWQAILDQETGVYYYWNPATSETSLYVPTSLIKPKSLLDNIIQEAAAKFQQDLMTEKQFGDSNGEAYQDEEQQLLDQLSQEHNELLEIKALQQEEEEALEKMEEATISVRLPELQEEVPQEYLAYQGEVIKLSIPMFSLPSTVDSVETEPEQMIEDLPYETSSEQMVDESDANKIQNQEEEGPENAQEEYPPVYNQEQSDTELEIQNPSVIEDSREMSGDKLFESIANVVPQSSSFELQSIQQNQGLPLEGSSLENHDFGQFLDNFFDKPLLEQKRLEELEVNENQKEDASLVEQNDKAETLSDFDTFFSQSNDLVPVLPEPPKEPVQPESKPNLQDFDTFFSPSKDFVPAMPEPPREPALPESKPNSPDFGSFFSSSNNFVPAKPEPPKELELPESKPNSPDLAFFSPSNNFVPAKPPKEPELPASKSKDVGMDEDVFNMFWQSVTTHEIQAAQNRDDQQKMEGLFNQLLAQSTTQTAKQSEWLTLASQEDNQATNFMVLSSNKEKSELRGLSQISPLAPDFNALFGRSRKNISGILHTFVGTVFSIVAVMSLLIAAYLGRQSRESSSHVLPLN